MNITPTTTQSALTQRAVPGAVGGLAGGIAFGILMQLMGMMGMVAQLVGSDSAAVGWLVHLAISVLFGLGFTLVLTPTGLTRTPVTAAGLGLVYGVVLWFGGALIMMPAWLGMPVLQLGTTAWQSLMGHLVFGLVLGLVVAAMSRSTTPSTHP